MISFSFTFTLLLCTFFLLLYPLLETNIKTWETKKIKKQTNKRQIIALSSCILKQRPEMDSLT